MLLLAFYAKLTEFDYTKLTEFNYAELTEFDYAKLMEFAYDKLMKFDRQSHAAISIAYSLAGTSPLRCMMYSFATPFHACSPNVWMHLLYEFHLKLVAASINICYAPFTYILLNLYSVRISSLKLRSILCYIL